MAYGTKYRIEYQSAAKTDCEVRIQQDGYSGIVTPLRGGGAPFEVTWGQQNKRDLTEPLLISTAKIRFVGDADGELMQEVFDGGDTEYRVQFYEDGSLEWQGFLATDLWRDDPNVPYDVVELEAIDGLALLENRDQVNQLNDTFTYNLRTLLRGDANVSEYVGGPLDGASFTDDIGLHDLPIYTSMDWHSFAVNVPDGECPLDHIRLPSTAYKEQNDNDNVEGNLDQRAQLEDMLERFGLKLFQAGGAWHVRQRGQVEANGTLKRWRMGVGASDFGAAAVDDVSADVPTRLRAGTPRSRVQRVRSFTSTFSFGRLGDLYVNPGFESDNLTGWTTGGAPNGSVSVKNYDDTAAAKNSTQENLYVLAIDPGDTTDPTLNGGFAEQTSGFDLKAFKNGRMKVEVNVAIDDIAYQNDQYITLESGNSSLRDNRLVVQQFTEAAEDEPGVIVVDGFGTPSDNIIIPKGSKLPVEDGSGIDAPAIVGYIEVEEDVYTGDEEITAFIDADLPQGSEIIFYTWTLANWEGVDWLSFPERMTDGGTITKQTFLLPLTRPDGALIEGQPKIGFQNTYYDNSDGPPNDKNRVFFVDDVKIEITDADADVIDSISYVSVDDQFGRAGEMSHRVGDGPAAGGDRGLDYDLFTGTAPTGDWKTSPYGTSESPSGVPLERITAEYWMRQHRGTLDRRTYKVDLRGDSTQVLTPEYVYIEDGRLYTVTYAKRGWGNSNNAGTVELTQKKDFGTAGLSGGFTFLTDSGGSGSSGSGSVTVVGSQNVTGAATWGELADKPQDLFARTGDTDLYGETVALSSSDITGALGFNPADETTQVTAGTNLTGGGDLTQNRTVSVVDSPVFPGDVTVQGDLEVRGQADLGALSLDTVTLANLEFSTAPAVNGNLMFDQSTGLAVYYDAGSLAPGGYTGYATLLDSANTTTGQNIVLSGGRTADSRPDVSLADSVSVVQDLGVGGDTVLSGTLGVTGDTDLNAALSVSGKTDLTGRVFVGDSTPPADWPLAVRFSDGSAYNPSGNPYIAQLCYTDAGGTGHSLNLGYRDLQDGGVLLKAATDAPGRETLYIGNSAGRPQITVAGNGDLRLGGVGSVFADEDLFYNGRVLTAGSATGFSGSGTIIDQNEAWFDDLKVRGTLLAFEFEARKITASRGPLAITPGGGKLESVVDVDGMGAWTLEFAEDPGIASGDLLIIQEADLSGSTRTIVKRTYLRATSTGGTFIEADLISGDDPAAGDDVVVVGSNSDPDRESLLYADPYVPALDVLTGIQTRADWESRQPRIRLGDVSGIGDPDLTPSGFGLYGENVFLKGALVATSGFVKETFDVGSGIRMAADGFGASAGAEVRISADGSGTGSTNLVKMFWANSSDWGIKGKSANSLVFELGSANRIASFSFTENRLTDGDVFLGQQLEDVDAESTALFGNYLGDPTFKLRGPDTAGGSNYVFGIGTSSSTVPYFEIANDGDAVLRASADEVLLADWSVTADRISRPGIELGTLSPTREGLKISGAGGEVSVELAGGDVQILAIDTFNDFVSIGAGYNRSSMGITVRAAGNTVLDTNTSGATFGNVTINDELLMGNDGVITNPDVDFRVDSSGFAIEHTPSLFSDIQRKFKLVEGSTILASLSSYNSDAASAFGGDKLASFQSEVLGTSLLVDGGQNNVFMRGSTLNVDFSVKTLFDQTPTEFKGGDGSLTVDDFNYGGARAMFIKFDTLLTGASRPPDSWIRSNLQRGECALVPLEFSNGNINMMFCAHRSNGDVETGFMGT